MVYLTAILSSMSDFNEHKEMQHLLEHNSELLAENNRLLKKMHRMNVYGVILRVVWYVLLIGLPFALYFYILEPYFAAFGSSFELFREGVGEIPGIKSIDTLFN